MNILFVVPYVPNLVRVRPYNLIRQLTERGHDVTVVTLWTNDQEREDIKQLRRQCHKVEAAYLPNWRSYWNCVQALPRSTPLQAVYCWQPSLVSRLAARVGHVDIIHVEHLRGTLYGLTLKSQLANGSGPVPVVWDSVDCITHLFRQAANRSSTRLRRWLTRFEVRRTEKHEGWLVNQFNRVLVTSPVERTALLSLIQSGPSSQQVEVLPNGVDLHHFKPGDAATRRHDTIVVSGKMSYHANEAMVIHFARNVLPLIWARRPEARLNIVGQNPPHAVQNLAQDKRITVLGTVRDMRPHLQQATIAVAPLTYGAGIQNKVLEAMACATPVVASPQAVSALSARPGQDVLIAREPPAFADEVVSLLENKELQRRVGEAGRRFVECHHRWNDVATQLERTYDELVGARN